MAALERSSEILKVVKVVFAESVRETNIYTLVYKMLPFKNRNLLLLSLYIESHNSLYIRVYNICIHF